MHPRRRPPALLPIVFFCATLLGGCTRLADALFLSPEKGSGHSPGALGMVYEDLSFLADDGTALHGWWLPGEPQRPTVLVLHDGTGNVSARADLLRQFRDWLGVSLFIFDYRGFGRSGGDPSDLGMVTDVAAARSLLSSRGWDRYGLLLYGMGLGAYLATGSAVAAPPDGVVLEAAFPDLASLVSARHPMLGALLSPWLEGRFDILGPLASMRTPVLFLHGDQDRQVPIGLGWQVYDACSAPKRFRTISGSDHGDTAFSGGETYWGAWRGFLEEVQGDTADADAAPL